jgi:GT2 family glycosyltransferase
MNLVAVVLSYDGREDTLAALESLRGIPTVVVDNGSSDGSADAVAERFPEVELIRAGVNLGYAAGNNVGIRRALERGADWVLLLNNDATVEPGLVEALEAAAAVRPDAGVLACKVLFADSERLWYAGAEFDARLGRSRHQRFGEPDEPEPGGNSELRDTGRATGAGMAVSRAAIEAAGLLDEELFLYAEDLEWCLRIREAGFAVVYVPEARVRHRVSAATGGAGSPTTLYYETRNVLAVVERHRPLPRGLTGVRRAAVVAPRVLLAARRPESAWAAVRGWRDYRRGRMGRRG